MINIKKQRLPLGALIRNENSNTLYLVIKIVKSVRGDAYYLCCIFDPTQDNQKSPFKFHFIIDDEKSHKLTILNSDTTIEKDGTLTHVLTFLDVEEATKLQNNRDFMLRYFTACKFYKRDKRTYEIKSVDNNNRLINLLRKTTWFERFLLKASQIVIQVSWFVLLTEFTPFIPENVDDALFLETVNSRSFFL